jgi:hypothetical protein
MTTMTDWLGVGGGAAAAGSMATVPAAATANNATPTLLIGRMWKSPFLDQEIVLSARGIHQGR